MDGALTRTLRSYGLSLAERAPITQPSSHADFPAREREVATAALRFKLAEIDTVLIVYSGGLASDFMRAAERNRYWPRYGLTTVELRVAAAQGAFEVPERQLANAQGIGWLPDFDLRPRRPRAWPVRDGCLDFYRQRGISTETFLDRIMALYVCDTVGFLRAAVATAPGPLSTTTVSSGAASLEASYTSPSIGPTRFGPARRDGAVVYRDAVYAPDCGCFTYTGKPRLLP